MDSADREVDFSRDVKGWRDEQSAWCLDAMINRGTHRPLPQWSARD